MPITVNDIRFKQAQTNSDAASNGGRMATADATPSLFPNVTGQERVAGLTRYRKEFVKNEQASASGEKDLTFVAVKAGLASLSTAQDHFRLAVGDDTDVQTDAGGYANWAGVGTLAADVTAGVTQQIVVDCEEADGFQDGDQIRIDDGVNDEFLTIESVSWGVNQATLTLGGSNFTQHSYTAGVGTIVSAVISLGDIVCASAGWVENSAGGSYDETIYPLILYPVGTVTEDWTLTFTSVTNFEVTGSIAGYVGNGSISSDFQPANGASYYFKLQSAGWGGTWSLGDTITFSTQHSAKALWVVEIVPAGIDSHAANQVSLWVIGDTT